MSFFRCRAAAVASAFLLCAFQSLTHAQRVVVEDFEDISDWEVISSDGVVCQIGEAEGIDGKAMRIAYDFRAGAGFCIVRKRVDLDLHENYRVAMQARGDAPANDLELKLVSPSGADVWWVNRRAFNTPEDWSRLSQKRRHFEFAWGPSGGAPMTRVGWIELAIAASAGGAGELLIDELTYEPLPAIEPRPDTPVVRTGAGLARFPIPLGAGGPRWVELGFPGPVEINAALIDWDGDSPESYSVLLHLADGTTRSHEARGGGAGLHGVFAPETEILSARIVLPPSTRGTLGSFRLSAVDESADANAFIEQLARGSEKGRFPPAMSGVPTPWTIVGLPDNHDEALVTRAGDIEFRKGGWTLRPGLVVNGKAITWADVQLTATLESGVLPIPCVRWDADAVSLEITAVATRVDDRTVLLARYRITNTGQQRLNGRLVLSAAPFQALPPWQRLNLVGGHAPIRSVMANTEGLLVSSRDRIRALTPADGVGTSSATLAAPSGALPEGQRSTESHRVDDAQGFATGSLVFDLSLNAGEQREIVIAGAIGGGELGPLHTPDPLAMFDHTLARERENWNALLATPRIELPPGHRAMVDAARTTTAHILINQDGPAIQPGSRTYERSWIRDGSITSLALIAGGHTDRARAFVDWYAPYQYPSGKAPCVVDHRGPDPVDEHDSTGELIFAIWRVYLATGDQAFLERHYPRVRRGVSYLRQLRAQRLTETYEHSDDPVQRAKFGLVPESISHEGYSAKPMHSYWDDFFVLRGLEDAAAIAHELGHSDDQSAYLKLTNEFRDDLFSSIRLAAATHGIGYVPGSVELGDFDATSTSIAVFPGELLGSEIDPLLRATFDRYWAFFLDRRDGRVAWRDFTPYEFRLAGAFVRLGQPERAHGLMSWLMDQRTPSGWNQWPEVGYREASMVGFVGDIPHTWVGSAFILSFYSLFAYERGDTLVVAPALDPAWIQSEEGVSVEDLHTRWGGLSYTCKREGDVITLLIKRAPAAPGGLVLCPPIGGAYDLYKDGEPLTPGPDGRVVVPSAPTTVEFRVRD